MSELEVVVWKNSALLMSPTKFSIDASQYVSGDFHGSQVTIDELSYFSESFSVNKGDMCG